jgi:2-keto-myo-inositol isomerase
MKICLNTVTVGPQHRLEAIMDAMGRWGYAGIEIEGGRLADALKRASVADVRRRLADQGIAPASLMAWGFRVDGDLTGVLEEIRRHGDLARELGAPTLLVFAGQGGPTECAGAPPPAARPDFMRRAGESARAYAEAAGEGVTISLEPIGGSNWLGTPEDALAIADASGHPRVGVMIDFFHYYRSGVSAASIAAIPLDRLFIVHADDCEDRPVAELNDSHRVYPGEGILPLRARLALLRRMGYRGHLSIELFNRAYWEAPLDEVVERCYRGLAGLLAVA